MEANPIKEDDINEFNIKINYKDKDSNILFTLKNDKNLLPEIYEEEYNLEKLEKENLLFSLYQKVDQIILFMQIFRKK